MTHCTVFYKKNSDFTAKTAPTRAALDNHYGKVWEIDIEKATPDQIFKLLNMDRLPEGFVWPEGVRHSSMSVGDIVQLGDTYYLCLPVKWFLFTLK